MRREDVWDKVYDQIDDMIEVLREECRKRLYSRVSFAYGDLGWELDDGIGDIMENVVVNLECQCRKKLKNIK